MNVEKDDFYKRLIEKEGENLVKEPSSLKRDAIITQTYKHHFGILGKDKYGRTDKFGELHDGEIQREEKLAYGNRGDFCLVCHCTDYWGGRIIVPGRIIEYMKMDEFGNAYSTIEILSPEEKGIIKSFLLKRKAMEDRKLRFWEPPELS